MITRLTGKPKIEWLPKDASVVFPRNGLVYWNGTGEIIPADATSGDHAGVLVGEVVATDADYATALAKRPVDVPTAEDTFLADVETGTLTTAMVGNQYDLVADGDAIDVTATSKKVVTVVGFVSATKAVIKINAIAAHKDVVTT
jgi:hypothetical protein